MEGWDTLKGIGWMWGGLMAILGAMAGSFASAAIHRIPREGMTLIHPLRSFCPHCRHTLRWHDNLPILGWLLLRGKCRDCGVGFGASYLGHELILASVFLVAGSGWAAISLGTLLLTLVALTALWIAAGVDWNHLILPDGITLGGVVLGLLAAPFLPQFQLGPDLSRSFWFFGFLDASSFSSPATAAFAAAVAGALISFLLLFGIRALFSYLLGQEALGFGDVKFLAAVGALLGLEAALWTLLVGVFLGALLGLLNVIRMSLLVRVRNRRRGVSHSVRKVLFRGWRLGRRIPFGPPLVLGTVLLLLFPGSARVFFLETWPETLRLLLN